MKYYCPHCHDYTEPTTANHCPKCGSCLDPFVDSLPPPYRPMQGWECPRCHTIHSPFVQQCSCPPAYTIKVGGGSE